MVRYFLHLSRKKMRVLHHAILGCICSAAFVLSDSIHADFESLDDSFCAKDSCASTEKSVIPNEIIIDESLNELSQDDPRLIKILKEKYLVPPSKDDYNLPINNDEWDAYAHEEEKAYPMTFGQYGQPRAIDK